MYKKKRERGMTQKDIMTPRQAANCSINSETGRRSGGRLGTEESELGPDTLHARGPGRDTEVERSC